MTAARLTDDRIAQARAVSVLDLAQLNLNLRGRRRHFNGPCPLCGGDDRFFIDAAKNKFGCRGCGVRGQGGIDFMMFLDGCSFVEAVTKLVRMPTPTSYQPIDNYDSRKHALDLWCNRKPLIGSIAEVYLREARGIGGPLPSTLGFLPAWRDRPPAMIAPFGLPGDKVEAVHLTFHKPDGSSKAADVLKPKQVRGEPLGKPIILTPVNDLLGLAITEGIEDGLTAHEALGLGVWAAGSSAYMPALADTVPDYVETVTIFAHDDAAGQRGAVALAEKLTAHGIEVVVEGIQR